MEWTGSSSSLGECILAVLAIVASCFIAGAIATWWEQRKRDKEQKERENAREQKG